MSFRDDAQLSRACKALCDRIPGTRGLWIVEGPTVAAIDVLKGTSMLSTGERLMVLAAWAFWSGDEELRFAELLTTLSAGHLEAIFSLALAAAAPGGDAVDAWLARHERGGAS